MIKQIQFLLAIVLLFLTGCKDSYGPVNLEEYDLLPNQLGVFIVNEGNYNGGNATLSYYLPDSLQVSNNLFSIVNGQPLGDVGYSMMIRDSLGYIVVNNSKKIEVIDINSYEIVTTITGFSSPRFIEFIDDSKAYVSDLSSTSLGIIDLQTNMVSDVIPLGYTSEAMVMVDNKVFVTNWSFGNQVLVIDALNDILLDSVTVPLEPNSIVKDKFNRIWVLSSGGFMNDEIPALTCINPANHDIIKTISFSSFNQNPTRLNVNGGGDTLYYLNQHVYQLPISSDEIYGEEFISSNERNLYSLAIHPDKSLIFVADAKDYNQAGDVYVYKLNGILVDQFTAGVIPSGFCFQ
jgi:DNA-binding beta-propeller fold protein YncE